MPKVTRSRLSNLWPDLWHICGFAEQEKRPPFSPKINLYHLLPHRIKPMIDWDCSEVVTAIWEGSIQSRVIDRDLGETRQTGTDGHNVTAQEVCTLAGRSGGRTVALGRSYAVYGMCLGCVFNYLKWGHVAPLLVGKTIRWHYAHVAMYKKTPIFNSD